MRQRSGKDGWAARTIAYDITPYINIARVQNNTAVKDILLAWAQVRESKSPHVGDLLIFFLWWRCVRNLVDRPLVLKRVKCEMERLMMMRGRVASASWSPVGFLAATTE